MLRMSVAVEILLTMCADAEEDDNSVNPGDNPDTDALEVDDEQASSIAEFGCKLLNCDLACNKVMDQQKRVVFSIVPILLLILLLRRARRIRFLLAYNYLDLGPKKVQWFH